MPKLAFAPLACVALDPVDIGFKDDAEPTLSITSPKENGETLSFVSPACVTHYPRQVCASLDLNEYPPNADEFGTLITYLDRIDEQLLDFVYQNQSRLFGVGHLSKALYRSTQYRSAQSGIVSLVGVGQNKVCDRHGTMLPGVEVRSGDVVAAAMYVSEVFVDRANKEFGIEWACDDVCIVRQRDVAVTKSEKTALRQMHSYPFSHDFTFRG